MPPSEARKFCDACGRPAAADARFCSGCGRGLTGGARPEAAGAARAAADDEPAAPSGAPSGAPPAEETVFELRSVAVASLGALLLCIVTVGIAWLVLLVMRMTVRYRISTQRIEMVTGIATQKRRTIELFRIHDFEIVEPFFLRMRGAGHLVIRSQDAGEPVVTLRAIPGVREVHERLRALVAAERRRNNVKLFEES